jgi:hypothetical protein
MSPAVTMIDASVVIDRVRVRVKAREIEPPLVNERTPPARQHAADHRIVVHELRIDTEAALGELEARRLGERVAGALGEGLTAWQARRADAICAGRSRGGRICVRTLRVVLRGGDAERPDARAIALALAGAVERSMRS